MVAAAWLALALALGGCSSWRGGAPGSAAAHEQGEGPDSGLTVIVDDDAESDGSGLTIIMDDGAEVVGWSEDVAPDYYLVLGPSQVEDVPDIGSATYAPLDGLGRAGRVAACVTYDMMQAGRDRDRENISSIHPSGWGHNAEVDIELPDGMTYHGQFWNRSHLLAKSLGGADVAENLVCGTRMQNVGSNHAGAPGGMAYCEDLGRTWLEGHPEGWVAYVAEPVYEGNELVCRSVLVDILSSDGELDLRVEVFNAAKGYGIDYATGEFWAAGCLPKGSSLTEHCAHTSGLNFVDALRPHICTESRKNRADSVHGSGLNAASVLRSHICTDSELPKG